MRTRTLWASLLAAAPLVIFGCDSGTSTNEPTNPTAGAGGAIGTAGSGNSAGAAVCSAPSTSCSGACVDTTTNSANCGTCGKACAVGTSCQASQCVCAAPLAACGAACVNTQSDAMNCGACGTVCPTTAPFCGSGVCSATCALTQCSPTSCINTMGNDPLNCGGCAMACGVGQTCTAGVCSGGVGGGGSGGGGNTGGAGGAAGAGTGGSGGGATRPGGCAIKPGVVSDFEEGPTSSVEPPVLASEGRAGSWYIYNDKSSTTQKMAVEASGGTADCDKYALHVTGTGYSMYAGLGMNFAGMKTPAAYNATSHQFTGISFKAKLGSGADMKSPVRFNIATPATQSSMQPGGTCNESTTTCYQHVGQFLTPGTDLTTSFKTFTYCFDRDLYPLSLPSNLTNAQRDAIGSNLLQLQFDFNNGKNYSGGWNAAEVYPEFAKTLPFDFWVDDVQLLTGDCTNTVASPSNGSPAKPFPQNAAIGTCMPSTNASKFSAAITRAYATWTKNFVQNDHVISPENQNHISSEGLGYGMLIAAAMGDKTAFDKFWGYVQTKLSGGLMNWREDQSGSASDADVDIAYALLMANAQWPSGGYKAKADTMISAISSSDIKNNIVTGGSQFTSVYNPSYFAPAWFRKFGSSFASVITTNYGLVNSNVSSPTSGIPTDWANQSDGKPSGTGSANVTSQIQDASGAMGYDAARVPWRLGLDACLGGDNTTAVKSIVTYFNSKYPSIDLMPAGFIKSSGAKHPKAQDIQASYIGSMGVAGMGAGNAAMRDRAFRTVLDILDSGDFNHTYYPTTVGLLTLLALAGDFPTVQ